MLLIRIFLRAFLPSEYEAVRSLDLIYFTARMLDTSETSPTRATQVEHK